MKTLIAIFGAALTAATLVSCTSGPEPATTATGLPYGAYSTSNDSRVPVSQAYRSWTTAQLQKRRQDLYYTVPQSQTRQGVPEYITHGGQLPQQDEIRVIEAELNRRYHSGDKTALLKETWPEVRRHTS